MRISDWSSDVCSSDLPDQPILDPADQSGTFENERSVELDEARSGADAGIGVLGRGDPADPDQWQPAFRGAAELTQDVKRAVLQRHARKPARLARQGRTQPRQIGRAHV